MDGWIGGWREGGRGEKGEEEKEGEKEIIISGSTRYQFVDYSAIRK